MLVWMSCDTRRSEVFDRIGAQAVKKSIIFFPVSWNRPQTYESRGGLINPSTSGRASMTARWSSGANQGATEVRYSSLDADGTLTDTVRVWLSAGWHGPFERLAK